MPEVGTWKDWLLWPLKTRFERQVSKASAAKKEGFSGGPEHRDLFIANAANLAALKRYEEGSNKVLIWTLDPETLRKRLTLLRVVPSERAETVPEASGTGPEKGPNVVEMPKPR